MQIPAAPQYPHHPYHLKAHYSASTADAWDWGLAGRWYVSTGLKKRAEDLSLGTKEASKGIWASFDMLYSNL